jgi:Putative zinc-finger
MLRKIFRRSCRQVSRLISEQEDRPLAMRERVVLRLHLRICEACVRYESQVKFMRKAIGSWSNYSDRP